MMQWYILIFCVLYFCVIVCMLSSAQWWFLCRMLHLGILRPAIEQIPDTLHWPDCTEEILQDNFFLQIQWSKCLRSGRAWE